MVINHLMPKSEFLAEHRVRMVISDVWEIVTEPLFDDRLSQDHPLGTVPLTKEEYNQAILLQQKSKWEEYIAGLVDKEGGEIVWLVQAYVDSALRVLGINKEEITTSQLEDIFAMTVALTFVKGYGLTVPIVGTS
jgi:hypothetical protein